MTPPGVAAAPLRNPALRAVILAQFLGALADNALLLVAIDLLNQRAAPAWMTPALRIFLYLSYVVLAPWAGQLADRWPKGRVLTLTCVARLAGCAVLALDCHPLLVFSLIGMFAVANAPARYGLLAELAPGETLVASNAWLEIATVGAIFGGVGLGSLIVSAGAGEPAGGTGGDIIGASMNTAGLAALALLYGAAGWLCLQLPAGSAASARPLRLRHGLLEFSACCAALWRNAAARTALLVTALFWAVAAVLQFVVISWGSERLGLPLAQAGLLQCLVAAGMVAGALLAARLVSLCRAQAMLPAGLLLGLILCGMAWVDSLPIACVLLFLTGALAGLLLVPFNARLQEHGAVLLAAGNAVAVQGLFENFAALVFLAAYSLLLAAAVPLVTILTAAGLLVTGFIALLLLQQRVPRRA